jgi:hypothetical protein
MAASAQAGALEARAATMALANIGVHEAADAVVMVDAAARAAALEADAAEVVTASISFEATKTSRPISPRYKLASKSTKSACQAQPDAADSLPATPAPTAPAAHPLPSKGHDLSKIL